MEIKVRSSPQDTNPASTEKYLKLSKLIGSLCDAILKQQSPNISRESIQRTIGVIAKLVVRIIMNHGGSASFAKEGSMNEAHIDGIDSDSNLAQQIHWISKFLESNHNSIGQSHHTSDSIQIIEHGGIKLNMNVSNLTDYDINLLRLTIGSIADKLVLVFRALFRIEEDRLKKEEEVLKHRKEVIQDPLTGVARRAALEDVLIMSGFFKSIELNDLGGVIMVDLDGFKSVNDTYGHDAGDAVLKHTANAMVDVLEEISGTKEYELDIPGITKDWMVCRLGGDEFVVILGSNLSGSSEFVIEPLRQAIAEPLIINVGGKQVTIRQGASFGYSNSGDSLSALFKEADKNMYNEKGGFLRFIRKHLKRVLSQ